MYGSGSVHVKAYKQEYRKNSRKIKREKGLNGTGGTNEPVEEHNEDYVWLIIRVQSRVGDRVFLMSADDLAFKYKDIVVGMIGRVLAHNTT